jgi:hypothetical protein
MLKHPVPNADQIMLEHCTTNELLEIFERCLKMGSHRIMCSDLAEAWGTLFSDLYLTPNELTEKLAKGDPRIPEEKRCMLREFIRGDCAAGGHFVLDVIVKGGMIDRAALIMIAEMGNLAALEHAGTTALHMLANACDRSVRPALIQRAGIQLLSEVYDGRGISVLFTIFALGDLSRDDLDAMAEVFTKEDLENAMNRNRMGKNALEVFNESSERLKAHVPGERNKFFVRNAIQTTNKEDEPGSQVSAFPQTGGVSGAREHKADKTRPGQETSSGLTAAEKYDEMGSDPPNTVGKLVKKTKG